MQNNSHLSQLYKLFFTINKKILSNFTLLKGSRIFRFFPKKAVKIRIFICSKKSFLTLT